MLCYCFLCSSHLNIVGVGWLGKVPSIVDAGFGKLQ